MSQHDDLHEDLLRRALRAAADSVEEAAAANVAALEKVMDVHFAHAPVRVLLAALAG